MSEKLLALITGANKGIGLETAKQLAAKGYTVLLGARDEAKGRAAAEPLKAKGLDVHPIAIDVADQRSVDLAREQIERRFGKLDVLINNAGVFTEDWKSTPSTIRIPDIQADFDTNVFGVVRVTQAMLPLLRKSTAARIVNLTSVLGSMGEHQNPKSGIYGMLSAGYNMSKAAVNMFTVNLAHELRDTPIKVNAAHPGWVQTDMGGPNAPMKLEDGAKTSVWLATLGPDGPTGGYFHMQQRLPW